MLKPFIEKCSDINTPYCPCLLATTNHCTFCSKLQGKDNCDCNWSGVCIFYEQYWKNKLQQPAAVIERITSEAAPIMQEQIAPKTYRLKLKVAAKLAQQLDQPGAFVFIRRASDPVCSHFPVGVMQVADDIITLVIETVGSKSSRFILNKMEKIMLRGPYYNGVLGKSWIDQLTYGKVIVIAGGIGQAPAVPIIKKLLNNNNKLHLIVAPGKVGKVFITEVLPIRAMTLTAVESLRQAGFIKFSALLKENYDLCISAGPDAQHAAIIRQMSDCGINLPMAATNNATMCCGEGLCGSCQQLTQDNKTVKMCKTQLNYQQIMQE